MIGEVKEIMGTPVKNLVVFSDLDGTLLDATSYAFEAAMEALTAIEESQSALVLVSSKTRAELEPLRSRLSHKGPFIVENGGALFVPRTYFSFPMEGSVLRGDYWAVELGVPYARLREVMKATARDLRVELKGFGDMSVEEVAFHTDLPPADAVLAKAREFDEPFVFTGDGQLFERLQARFEASGLRCTRGGRFYHLLGATDKGTAMRPLLKAYERAADEHGRQLVTIGIGDSANDLPMLQLVDHPILVQKPDRSYDPAVNVPGLLYAPGIGPVAWNKSVLFFLALYTATHTGRTQPC